MNVREKYIDWTLADLYDDTIMPSDLRKAHRDNDILVWEAYGKAWDIKSEEVCISFLMERYEEISRL